MSGLDDTGSQVPETGGNARAILRDIVGLLESLLESGEGGSIDLLPIPLNDEDYDLLDEALGEGEVDAEVTALGATKVVETGISGVWWVTHYNDADEAVAEFIEVAFCPEILLSPEEDVAEGVEGLKAGLFEEHLTGAGRHGAE